MSIKKKKIIVLFSSVTAVAAAVVILSRLGNNPVSNAVNTILTPCESAVAYVVHPVQKFSAFLKNARSFQKENEQLRLELETVKKENKSAEEYKRENTRLKKLLQLTDDLETCETVPAKIIAYEPNNWFYTLTINKGTRNGIQVSDVVITDAGVVGQVCEVGFNWAKVSTLLDSNQSLGIKLSRTGDVGLVEGDVQLLKNRECRLSYISKNSTIITGDLLETSGLGGIYPAGLSVGKVVSVETDNTGELTEAIVKPSVDFDSLYEVLVVKSWDPKIYDRAQVEIEYMPEPTQKPTPQPTATPEPTETPSADETPTRKPSKTPEPTAPIEETTPEDIGFDPEVDYE